MKSYWAGDPSSNLGKMLARFLADYDLVCEEIAKRLKVGGRVIFVVGRRSTGSFRLMLDKFTIDCFKRRGFRLIMVEKRDLRQKRAPRFVNRFARSELRKSQRSARTVTMNSEIVIVLNKARTASSLQKQ